MNTPDLSDGPVPPQPSYFAWEGECYYGMTKKASLLISELWEAPGMTLNDKELAGPVWGDRDPHATVRWDQLTSVGQQANRFFKQHSIPFRVSTIHDIEPRLRAILWRMEGNDSGE